MFQLWAKHVLRLLHILSYILLFYLRIWNTITYPNICEWKGCQQTFKANTSFIWWQSWFPTMMLGEPVRNCRLDSPASGINSKRHVMYGDTHCTHATFTAKWHQRKHHSGKINHVLQFGWLMKMAWHKYCHQFCATFQTFALHVHTCWRKL